MNKKILRNIALVIGLLLIIGIGSVYLYTNTDKSLAAPSELKDKSGEPSIINPKYLPLLQLKSNDYGSKSVTDFRSIVFDAIENNNSDYLTLLDDAFGDKELQSLRFTNDDASFICNVLVPVSADSRKNYYYGGYVLRNEADKNYVIEFSIQYEIIEPNNLKSSELEDKLRALPNALSNHLDESKLDNLDDEANYEKEVISTSNSILTDLENDSIKFTVNYVDYSILDSSEPISFLDLSNDQMEPVTDSNIELILNTFKTDGYEKLPVLSYRTQVANKIDADKNLENLIDRVRFAIAENQESTQKLTQTQYNFLAYTLNASLSENYVKGAQQYSTELLIPNIRVQQYLDDPNYYLDYRLYYELTNEENTTVKTRDEAIYNVIAEIQNYVETSGADKLSDSVLKATCKEIVQNHSNSDISFSIESIYCIPQ